MCRRTAYCPACVPGTHAGADCVLGDPNEPPGSQEALETCRKTAPGTAGVRKTHKGAKNASGDPRGSVRILVSMPRYSDAPLGMASMQRFLAYSHKAPTPMNWDPRSAYMNENIHLMEMTDLER